MKLDKWPETIECDGWRWERECHHLGEISKGREFTYFAMDKIQAPVTSQPKFGEWIKCSERLPETSTYVLLWNQQEFVQGVGYLGTDGNAFYVDGDAYSIHNTTHWMPLPEAPK